MPEAMLHNVTTTSEVTQTYIILPAFGHRPMTNEIQNVLEEANKPKKGRMTRATKAGPSEQAQTLKKKVK